jgi:hypothetical protein
MTLDEMNDALAALAAVGQLAEAEIGLKALLAENPTARTVRKNLGLVLMSQGRYREAGPYYRERHLAPDARPKPALPYPEWAGEPVAGRRLLIFPEHGFGDEIMFARFAPVLARAGAAVTLLCAPPLERLFRESLPDVEIIAARGEVAFADPDYWSLTTDLLFNTGAAPDTLPAEPYLQARPSGRGGVGVRTRGNPAHSNDARRSLPEEIAAELLALPGAVDLDPAASGAPDFHKTAETVAGLDLVITVDTAVAHLAAALGKPVWILLPFFSTDWRWMRGRADSPWYPTAKLFRQGADQAWRPVLEAVQRAL